MNPLRSKAMIESAMSLVRLTDRRLPITAMPEMNSLEPPVPGDSAPCLASKSGLTSLDSMVDRAAVTSYSLIGW
ncbi:MAG: hypothetical protein QOF10_5461 [Kribbellaceae bacterium]|jgi:hypothetical protein|nr:hypothetical protein [Kribbellaceae bacterium]